MIVTKTTVKSANFDGRKKWIENCVTELAGKTRTCGLIVNPGLCSCPGIGRMSIT